MKKQFFINLTTISIILMPIVNQSQNSKAGFYVMIDSVSAVTKVADRYPNWSPDGKMIVFESNRAGKKFEIYTMNDNGEKIKYLSHNKMNDETPRWSPDGSFIMFTRYLSENNSEIFTMKSDGSNLKQLTNHPFRDGHAKFSPDGKKIIFNSQRDDEGKLELKNYELYEMNTNGTGIKRLTNYFEWDTYPSYSPDGRKILWRRILADTTAPRGYNSEIFVMNCNGSEIKNLTNHKSYDGYPEWSPDGTQIVFASSRHGQTTEHIQLFVMNADGTDVKQITFNEIGEEDNRPDWSLDGKRIVFNRVNKDGTRIYIMNIGSTKNVTFFNEATWSILGNESTASRGVAWGDYDNDNFPDLLVANTMNNSDFLFKNNTKGDFIQIVEGEQVTASGWTEGVSWADYDNDGDLDIFYTTQFGRPNELFRNEGDGVFKKVMAGDLTANNSSSTSACWCDYDLDGDLDVYVVERDGANDGLYNNDGLGNFKKVTKDKFSYSGGDGRTCAWGDINGDRYPELYVGNFLDKTIDKPTKGFNFYYANNKNGTFSKIENSIITSERNLTYGVSFIDYDQDNDLDLFLTNIGLSDLNILYQNNGLGNFIKANTIITKTESRPSKGHTWGDFDNDGDLDLFIANGTEGTTPKEIMNFLFLSNGNGDFELVKNGAIVNTPTISAGTAWADYDRDGDLDIFVSNWGNSTEKNSFYRNDLYNTNWLEISLKGTKSNIYGIGAKVRLKIIKEEKEVWLTRWLLPYTGYASQNEPIIHFGLGNVKEIEEIEIYWPLGIVDRIYQVKANQFLKISEGGGIMNNN